MPKRTIHEGRMVQNGQRLYRGRHGWRTEENVRRFVMVVLRADHGKPVTCRYIRAQIKQGQGIDLWDREARGLLRRMQVQGKPIISTENGFMLCTSHRQIQAQADRMIKHGLAEIVYARKLAKLPLSARMVGQLKAKLLKKD